MILITGATGTIGSEIVRQLVARGEQVRAVVRDPARAQPPAGVEVVRGDYTDLDSMKAAMAGARAAFIVGLLGPEYADADRALITTARDAGIGRIVKLSAIGTGSAELGRVGTWHLPGERAAQESGVDWTILRPSAFASNTLSWAEPIRNGQPVPSMTGTGAQGVIDPRDVAAVAVEALRSNAHAGKIYTLTGPDLLTSADQAATLAEVLGRPVSVVDLPNSSAREHLRAAGMSDAFIEGVLAGQEFVRTGGNAVTTDDVHRVLARPPRTYADWATDHTTAFLEPAPATTRRGVTLS